MNDHENRATQQPLENDRQIQLVVNRPDTDETTIDLGNVFQNMKNRRRLFAWVLVLCLTVGVCAPLLLYQINKAPLTVSSVVMLRYEAPVKVIQKDDDGKEKEVIPEDPEYALVTDLSAPDGSELDLNQLTSSYVLQTALDETQLSKPITAGQLRSNIKIQTVPTEESNRSKEAIQGLADMKNADAYKQLQSMELKYENYFVVSLTNGFGDEDSKAKIELTDEELRLLLDKILTVYNDYLVQTWADIRMPSDAFSVIDVQAEEPLDCLEELNTGLMSLTAYCNQQTDSVRSYRSWKTGRSLNDLAESLETFRKIAVEPRIADTVQNGITRDKASLLTSQRYLLRVAESDLEKVNADIQETDKLLASYKNNEIYVTTQDTDAAKTTKEATEQYNELVRKQQENYQKATELKTKIADLKDRIQKLEAAGETEVSLETEADLRQVVAEAQALYTEVREHMEMLLESPMYKTYETHSAPQGKERSFLASSAKKMIIGGIAGAVIACGLWFLAALMTEFSKNQKAPEKRKEAETK